jgi:hypothetical protein
MKETTAQPKLEKKLRLNKETIRVLTDREMMEIGGATNRPGRDSCVCQSITACPGGGGGGGLQTC